MVAVMATAITAMTAFARACSRHFVSAGSPDDTVPLGLRIVNEPGTVVLLARARELSRVRARSGQARRAAARRKFERRLHRPGRPEAVGEDPATNRHASSASTTGPGNEAAVHVPVPPPRSSGPRGRRRSRRPAPERGRVPRADPLPFVRSAAYQRVELDPGIGQDIARAGGRDEDPRAPGGSAGPRIARGEVTASTPASSSQGSASSAVRRMPPPDDRDGPLAARLEEGEGQALGLGGAMRRGPVTPSACEALQRGAAVPVVAQRGEEGPPPPRAARAARRRPRRYHQRHPTVREAWTISPGRGDAAPGRSAPTRCDRRRRRARRQCASGRVAGERLTTATRPRRGLRGHARRSPAARGSRRNSRAKLCAAAR